VTVTSGGVTTVRGDGNSTLKVFQRDESGGAQPAAIHFDRCALPGLTKWPIRSDASDSGRKQRRDPSIRKSLLHYKRRVAGRPCPPSNRCPRRPGGIAGGGMEQPVWNPIPNVLVSIPQLAGTIIQAELPEISTAGVVLRRSISEPWASHRAHPPDSPLAPAANLLVVAATWGRRRSCSIPLRRLDRQDVRRDRWHGRTLV